MHSQPDAPSTFPLPRVKSIPDTHTHSQPDARSTFPLSRVKLIPNNHTHSRPDVFRPSLLCVKSIPDVSLVLQLQSGEARSHTSLARCVLVCLSSLSMYMFLSCSVVRSSVTSLVTLRSFSMSHPQFPVSIYPCFIYLYSLPPSTLFSLVFFFLNPIKVHGGYLPHVALYILCFYSM